MNPDPIEDIFKKAEKVALPGNKKDAMRQNILRFMENNPLPQVQVKKKKWFDWHVLIDMMRLRVINVAFGFLVFFLLIGSISVAKMDIFVSPQMPFINIVPKSVTQHNSPVKKSPLSYSEAVNIYDGRRVQFSVNSSSNYCLVTPTTATFTNKTSIMLDNRSDKDITISLDRRPYRIKAYDFTIITLKTSVKLPHTVNIDCETGKNNATIILQ